ncbi:putative glycosyltransferase [Escherichia coli]|nr:putative glycosyltransferase [Escherichia coli]
MNSLVITLCQSGKACFMKYKLAIIIPVYNAEKYLADCLDSVFTQLKQDMLIIAVDDGSTDKSACILFEYKKAYSNRLYIISKKNGGLSSARNEGLTIAKKISTYTMFLDSDDLLNSSAIEEFLAIINDHHPSLIEFNIIRFGFGSEKKNILQRIRQ